MNLSLHSTGASFVAGKSSNNPRDLVITVLEKYPDADREEQFGHFRELLKKRADAFQSAVDWYFFLNMSQYMTTTRNMRRHDPVERIEAKAKQEKMIESVTAQIIMLDLTMTNGKLLGDCTGPELRQISSRFNKLADRVKSKPVRSVLTEDQVKAIMK